MRARRMSARIFVSVVALIALVASAGRARASMPARGYHPHIDPASFTTTVDNPWFPLVPGTTREYRGTDGGKPSHTVVTVLERTERIVGVDTVVVRDQVFLEGKLRESTLDYFAQDDHGTVWYFGEDTHELDVHGKVTTGEGTWRAGRNGGQPGIVMQAMPVVGKHLRQEYLKGHAEDRYQVVKVSTPIVVPYGSFKAALLTDEWTPLEPGVREQKYYARGIGLVSEQVVKGPPEHSVLTAVRK
jgi:hypothetical protein